MNLFLALFWLICAVMLLVYEQTIGPTRFRLWLGNHDFSYAWLMLLLVLYNVKRWWWIRSSRAKQRAIYRLARDDKSPTPPSSAGRSETK